MALAHARMGPKTQNPPLHFFPRHFRRIKRSPLLYGMEENNRRERGKAKLEGYVCNDDRKLLFQRLSTLDMDHAGGPTVWVEYRDGIPQHLKVTILTVGGNAVSKALESLERVGPPKPWPPVDGSNVWKDGKQVGKWTKWDKNGKKID